MSRSLHGDALLTEDLRLEPARPAFAADVHTIPQESSQPPPAIAAPEPHPYFHLAPPPSDQIDRLGPYRVLRVLGTGGMGIVFEAEDTQLRRLVALKVVKPELAASATARQRFLREARAASSLTHDHIITIYQVGEDRGIPFLAMQLLQGESLEDRLLRQLGPKGAAPLGMTETLRIGRQVAEGLAAAHEHGLIHRDIKPANIWLEADGGRVKILDFGLARVSNDQEQVTELGTIAGTPQYMAPEQAEGGAVDGRCDLFSLGCVLYRLCTGDVPFKGAGTLGVLRALALEQPRPPRDLNPEIPPGLAELILKLLAKKPTERPTSARAVADALAAIAARPMMASATDPDSCTLLSLPALKARRRRLCPPRVTLTALVLLLLSGGLLASTSALWSEPRNSHVTAVPLRPANQATKAAAAPYGRGHFGPGREGSATATAKTWPRWPPQAWGGFRFNRKKSSPESSGGIEQRSGWERTTKEEEPEGPHQDRMQ